MLREVCKRVIYVTFLRQSTLTIYNSCTRQMINEILTIAPDDARPGIRKTQDYSIETYNKTKNALLEKGMPIVENPFESE